MTYTLAMSPADEALIERYAARENLSVPDFIRRTVMDAIKRRAHVPRPKARDEMTDEEFYAVIDQGLEDVRQGRGRPAGEVFAEIRKEIAAHGL